MSRTFYIENNSVLQNSRRRLSFLAAKSLAAFPFSIRFCHHWLILRKPNKTSNLTIGGPFLSADMTFTNHFHRHASLLCFFFLSTNRIDGRGIGLRTSLLSVSESAARVEGTLWRRFMALLYNQKTCLSTIFQKFSGAQKNLSLSPS